MNLNVLLAHWRAGLLAALLAIALVLVLAMTRSPQFAGVVDVLVLPARIHSPENGEFARKALSANELRMEFAAFAGGDGLRKFLSKQDCLDLGGGACAQGLVEEFRKRISLEPLDEQGHVRIRLEDNRPRRAALLTEGLVRSYQEFMEERERERRRVEVEFCKAKVTEGESKLNLLRQAILSFRRMHLEAVDKYGGEKRDDWRQALLLEQINGRIGLLEERLKALTGLALEEFLQKANRWKLIDQDLANLATQYIDFGATMRSLDASGLSKDHVELVASRQRLEDSKKRLETGIGRFLDKMKAEVEQEKERRASLLADREETWNLLGEIGKRLEETQSIYESDSASLAQVQARLYAAQLESSLPVRVLDYEEGRRAGIEMRGPSLVTDLVLAPLMGILCGLLVIQVKAWRAEKQAALTGGRSRTQGPAVPGDGGLAVAT